MSLRYHAQPWFKFQYQLLYLSQGNDIVMDKNATPTTQN